MEEKKDKKSNSLLKIFKENIFIGLLLFIFLVLLSWPYISFINNSSLEFPFTYYFIVWGLIIIALFIISLAIKIDENND